MPTSLLLADDSPTIAKILGMALASEDYQIRSVLTAEEAIRELKANPPFFFLVDLTLPGKSGFEFAQMIRSDSRLAKVKVVLLSSAFEPVEDATVKACGADLVIAKPFDPSELRAALRSIRDAPPTFTPGSKVSGSLSGLTVVAPEGTRTSLTDSDLMNARTVIGKTTETALRKELLLGMQNDLDANSILAGLAENAPTEDQPNAENSASASKGNGDLDNSTAMLDLSGAMPVGQIPETVLDLSNSFNTPAGGTALVDFSTLDFNDELVLDQEEPKPPLEFDATPPTSKGGGETSANLSVPPSRPPGSVTPAAPPRTPELSPNAEALAAFFSAEIDSHKAPAPAAAPPLHSGEAEDFEKSISSIEWDQSAKADLDCWSASTEGLPASPPPKTPSPPRAEPSQPEPPRLEAAAPYAAHAAGASATAARSSAPATFLFDTGGSNFRFAEDYITRITKSFVGNVSEETPKDFGRDPVFPKESSDAPRPTAIGGGGGAGNWNPIDAQKMEQIVREEVQMAVREVVEKVAWEVIPELAENLIKKELEKVMKQLEG